MCTGLKEKWKRNRKMDIQGTEKHIEKKQKDGYA